MQHNKYNALNMLSSCHAYIKYKYFFALSFYLKQTLVMCRHIISLQTDGYFENLCESWTSQQGHFYCHFSSGVYMEIYNIWIGKLLASSTKVDKILINRPLSKFINQT